jgi:hypothetical protein
MALVLPSPVKSNVKYVSKVPKIETMLFQVVVPSYQHTRKNAFRGYHQMES